MCWKEARLILGFIAVFVPALVLRQVLVLGLAAGRRVGTAHHEFKVGSAHPTKGANPHF
jgi:hypothetical protein